MLGKESQRALLALGRPATITMRIRGVMENVSINWARDLPAPARTAIEKLLGRSLRDDEEVSSIMALDPHPAPSGEARRASAERLKGP